MEVDAKVLNRSSVWIKVAGWWQGFYEKGNTILNLRLSRIAQGFMLPLLCLETAHVDHG